MTTRLLIILALLTSIACSTVDSANVATENITADITITNDGHTEHAVTATLREGSLTFIRLTGGDQLQVDSGHSIQAMGELSDAFDVITYGAKVADRKLGMNLRVRLQREHFPSAMSDVRMPESFELLTPPDTYSVHEPIPIEWDWSANDPMTIEIEGECIRNFEETISYDPGHYLVPAGVLEPSRHWEGGRCRLDVLVKRSAKGHLDGRLDGGSIKAHQVRTMHLWLVD